MAIFALRALRFSRNQISLLLLTAAALFCLYLTRYRGAWLGLFAGSFLALVLYRQWKSIAILVFTGLVGLAFLPKHMLIHLDADNQEQSIVERFHLWQRAVHVIEAKPLRKRVLTLTIVPTRAMTKPKAGAFEVITPITAICRWRPKVACRDSRRFLFFYFCF